MPKKREIGQRLKDRAINKAELARHLGMTRQGLAYHIKGDDEIEISICNKILEFLGEEKVKEPGVEYNADLQKRIRELESLVTVLAERNLEQEEKIKVLTDQIAQLSGSSEQIKKLKQK